MAAGRSILIGPSPRPALDNDNEAEMMTTNTAANSKSRSKGVHVPRIPLSLQSVFLASNRGNKVTKPPPGRVAFKVYKPRGAATGLGNRFVRRTTSRGGQQSADFALSSASHQSSASSKQHKNKKTSSPLSCDLMMIDQSGGYNDDTSASGIELNARTRKKKLKQKAMRALNPQAYLDALIRQRGYSTESFRAQDTAYYNKPTPLQLASYHTHLIQLIKQGKIQQFQAIIKTGISLEASNRHGETIVHTCARLGKARFLRALLACGCTVSVADDVGRTPLHQICWKARPCFETIELLLRVDRQLLYVQDNRGHLPLSYVPPESWNDWLEFLQSKKEELWPQGGDDKRCKSPSASSASSQRLTRMPPCSRPVPDPPNALPLELARMVASGSVKPSEVSDFQIIMLEDDDEEEEIVFSNVSTTSRSVGTKETTTSDDCCGDSESDDDDESEEEEEDESITGTAADRSLLSDLLSRLDSTKNKARTRQQKLATFGTTKNGDANLFYFT